jgi:hypothetical protein
MKVDYNKGKVYLIEPIVEHDESEIYIGSTTEDYLSKRFYNHKSTYKCWLKNGKTGKVSVYNLFNKYGVDNCKIILLENVYANTKDELLSRESFYIRKLKCINKVIPDRSSKEYYETNKDTLLNYNKKYYKTNKDEISNKQKEYYETNKDTLLNYKKEYYETNKDTLLNYRKQYYELNKIKILEKIDCNICNCKVNRKGLKSEHYKSIKHINNLKLFNNQIDNHVKRMNDIIQSANKIKFVFKK